MERGRVKPALQAPVYLASHAAALQGEACQRNMWNLQPLASLRVCTGRHATSGATSFRVDLGGSWKLTGIGRHAVLQRVTHTFSAHRYFASFPPRRSSIPVSRVLVITHIWLTLPHIILALSSFSFKSPTGRMLDNLAYTCYENTIPSRGKHGKHGKHVTPG